MEEFSHAGLSGKHEVENEVKYKELGTRFWTASKIEPRNS